MRLRAISARAVARLVLACLVFVALIVVAPMVASAQPTDNYSYNAAGGAPTPASSFGDDQTFITLGGPPSLTGFTFTGWSDGNATYAANASYQLLSNGSAIVFTAQWTAVVVPTDNYSYNAAGGAPTPGSSFGDDQTFITLGGAPSLTGFTFTGWSDGNATYAANASYQLLSNGSAITFTAQWTAVVVPTDNYSYNAAGGAPTPGSSSGLNGAKITVGAAPTKSGFTFQGWSDGSATYAAGASYTLSSNGSAITFTAQWTAVVVPTDNYSYNAAGGAPTPGSSSGLNGAKITVGAAPTRAGYVFGGWSDGSATYAAGASYTLHSNG